MIDQVAILQARRALGEQLAAYRQAAGLKQEELAPLLHYGRSSVANVETGRQKGPQRFCQRCDEILGADGALLAAYEATEAGIQEQRHQARPATKSASGSTLAVAAHTVGEEHVKRRRLVIDLGLIGLSTPLAVVEAVRHRLAAFAATGQSPDIDEWDEITWEYARSFYDTPVERLLRDLTADLSVLEQRLSSQRTTDQSDFARVGGQLATIAAMAWASAGEIRHARRWWRTARQLADRSCDVTTRMWVRGWEVANGLYEQRQIAVILERARESAAVGGDVACAGTAGMYAGLAQTLAVAGRADEAVATLMRVAAITDQLPGQVVAAEDSMFGWPEVRLRHTESFVYTWLGDTKRAYAAQEKALSLYPAGLLRERAAMLFHRAACMIRDGDISGGLAFADRILNRLPMEHHTELVYAIGRAAVGAVPPQERKRREVVELKARLALPAGSEH
jgi:transcriptional regulator with XRE-family HTH domain